LIVSSPTISVSPYLPSAPHKSRPSIFPQSISFSKSHLHQKVPTPMTKRNYIRRKKCLNDSTSLVKSTLIFIHRALGTSIDADSVDRTARNHASAIEAVCRDPRTSRLTDTLYQQLMVSKTRELCVALICQSLPERSAVQILRELGHSHMIPRGPEPMPIPILTRPVDAEGEIPERMEFPVQGPETFGEAPRLRFEHADLFFDGDGCHDAMGRWAAE
jgi:hypothetical protein